MKTLYRGKIATVSTFKHANKELLRVAEPDVVVILPLYSGKVIMEKHYRPVLKKWLLVLPAGHVDGRESPSHAARRELMEETGYKAAHMALLFKGYINPGIMTTLSYTYVATGLEKSRYNKDKDEKLYIEKHSLSEVRRLIKSNMIIDKKTISAVLYYDEFS